jgi:YceI-like domain
MNTRYLLCFLALNALAGATTVRADSYKIDPAHSAILFKIGFLGVGFIYGRFDSFSGDITFDQNDPSKDAVNVEIKTDSVNTNAAKRDNDLSARSTTARSLRSVVISIGTISSIGLRKMKPRSTVRRNFSSSNVIGLTNRERDDCQGRIFCCASCELAAVRNE